MNASTHYRTHNCGELTEKDIDKEVIICGWVAKVRDFGGLTFVDIRDRYGITQLAFNIETNEALCLKARGLGREYVVQAKGKVIERSNKNKNIARNIERDKFNFILLFFVIANFVLLISCDNDNNVQSNNFDGKI